MIPLTVITTLVCTPFAVLAELAIANADHMNPFGQLALMFLVGFFWLALCTMWLVSMWGE